jgi:hypothetical protein
MITLKEAAAKARAEAENILGPDRATGVQLEEVELGSYHGKEAWHITLSMLRPNPFATLGVPAGDSFGVRDYKIFTLDRETGEFLSMKIRELATVE